MRTALCWCAVISMTTPKAKVILESSAMGNGPREFRFLQGLVLTGWQLKIH